MITGVRRGGAGRRRRGPESWIEIRPPSRWWPGLDLSEMWSYRDLSVTLARREITARYRQTLFGVAWAVIQPVAAAAIFSGVFGGLAGVSSDGLPYPVFVLSALAAWLYVSTAAAEASQVLVENSDLVTKVYFPRLLAPLSTLFPPLIDLAVALGVLGVAIGIYGASTGAAIATLPIWIVLLMLTTLGPSLWMAALNVQYRDVRHALQYVLQLWLFASPVVFSSSLIDGGWSYAFHLNPLAGAIDGFRWSLVGGPAPGPELGVSVMSCVVIALGGITYFLRAERRFADVI